MKKTYQAPNTITLHVEAQPMMAGSLGSGENPNAFDTSTSTTTEATSGNWSRRGSAWGDDDED